MLREEKGITLIALVVTIIVLLILVSIGISGGRASINVAKDNKLIADLSMVQHAILERYSKYKLTKEEQMLVGTKIEYEDAEDAANELDQVLPNEGEYYRLEQDDLKKLGLTEAQHTYIVNYEQGIAFNETIKQTSSGEHLFVNSKRKMIYILTTLA